MISEELHPAVKRLKRYDNKESTVYSQMNDQNCNLNKDDIVIQCNGQTGMESVAISKSRPDTQDILAKACSAIGLGSSMIDLVETPHQTIPSDNIKEKPHYPQQVGYVDKRSNPYFINGYKNYPQTNYSDPRTYVEGCNGYKEQAYAWNKHQPRKYYISSPQEKPQQHFPYYKNQFGWQSLNKFQPENLQDRIPHFTTRPCLPIQQQIRVSYNNNMDGVSHGQIQPNYVSPDGKRYGQQYVNPCQRQNTGTSSFNSCRYPQSNYINSNQPYVLQSNFPQQEVNLQQNKAYHGYENGFPQQQSNEFPVTKKIPGFENFCKKNQQKNMHPTEYSPICSPVSPIPRIIQQNMYEKCQNFPNSEDARQINIQNKSININNPKTECMKLLPNEVYHSSCYKDSYSNNSHMRPTIRHHTYPNNFDMSPNNFPGEPNSKQFYSPDGDQISFPQQDSTCNYGVYDYNSIQTQKTSQNIRHTGLNVSDSYRNCKNINNFSYHNNLEPKTSAIDYSLYGTDEINKNSIKNQKTNLPHSPNIELIPLEGTSIISTLSEVSNKRSPEISINAIKPTQTKEIEAGYLHDNFSVNRIPNMDTNVLHNTNAANLFSVKSDCVDSKQENKESSNWKESPQYDGIPELTSITESERLPLAYSQLIVKNKIEVQSVLAGDQLISGNTFVMAEPFKIKKILNQNFITGNSKHRPASEPLQPEKNSNEAKRPLSVPVNNIGTSCQSSLSWYPEDKTKIHNFQQKLKPILEHLLSIPEASSLLSLKENPNELLKHLVKLWGGTASLSTSKFPLVNIKENFLKLVKLLFKKTLLLEWGWQNATADQILDDLVTPSEGGDQEYKISLALMSFVCPPVPDSSHGLLTEDEFSSMPENFSNPFIYESI